MYEFPEALYFWTPNFYFNKYLRRCNPESAKYRPFIADILRYDYQIDEVIHRNPSSSSQNSNFQPLTESNRN